MAREKRKTSARVDLRPYLRKFGHRKFLPDQEAIIRTILRGRDVLGVLGTNAGKSLCFQIPALILPGLTVVVTPSISLMEEQVQKFNARVRGKKAAAINSTMSASDVRDALERLKDGTLKLFYLVPERLRKKEFRSLLFKVGVSLLVVDEAHCVVHDSPYRKHYLRLGVNARRIGAPQIAAFTATTPKGFTSEMIVNVLGMKQFRIFRGPLDRPNHFYDVRFYGTNSRRKAGLRTILQELKRRGHARGIIYCARKKDVEPLCGLLQQWKFSTTSYTGKMRSGALRRGNAQRFASRKRKVMVATKAFELGIDVKDVRFVVVFNTPASMSALFQQWGRAGRDGEPASCFLLHGAQDAKLQVDVFRGQNLERLAKSVRRLPEATKRLVDIGQFEEHLEDEWREIESFVSNEAVCLRALLLSSQGGLPEHKRRNRAKHCCTICERKRVSK